MKIAYTDPAWAVDDGQLLPARAAVERTVFGPEFELGLGVFADGAFQLAGPAFESAVADADALVVYRCEVTDELLEAAGRGCRVVARQGVGKDNLNLALLAERGLRSFHVPDYCVDEVASHGLGLLLALERGICIQDRLVKSGRWGIHTGHMPRRTARATVGIVGFGRIGRASARKLGVIYGSVMAYDPYVAGDLMLGHGVTPAASLTELFSCCGAIIVHAELTPETRDLIGADALSAASPGTYLVNVARGGLVDMGAVLAALDSGLLGGFASDVFTPEIPHHSELGRQLSERPNVIVSCHRAFLSAESEAQLRRRVAAAVRDCLQGEPCSGAGWLT